MKVIYKGIHPYVIELFAKPMQVIYLAPAHDVKDIKVE